MLDFRMYTFITLSQTLNFTKAAKELCMSQPAVTQHIKYLEHYYGVKLFYNEHKQLHLTNSGKLLQTHIQTMAADEHKLKEMIASSDDTLEQIRFGATRTIGEFILPLKLSNFINQHPNTSITMIVENTSMLLAMLKEGSIDFAFIEGYFIKDDVTYQRLSKEQFVAVKSPTYSLPSNVHALEDLKNETLILRESGSGTREILERILGEQNMNPQDFKKYIEIGNIHAIKELVKQGHGISFLYVAAVREELTNKTLEIVSLDDFNITREFNFVTRKNSLFHNFYQAFFEHISKE